MIVMVLFGIVSNYMEGQSKFDKKVSKRLSDFSKTIAAGIGGGGGSHSILDNRDVEFKHRNLVDGNAILIYDQNKQRFVSESITNILDRLRLELEVLFDKLIDTEGTYTYIGEAAPGSSPANPLWRIKRVEDLGGNDVNILWANGTGDQVHVWDNRASYTY